MLKEFIKVRVVRLLRPPESYLGWSGAKRPPKIGDVGTIVDIQNVRNLPTNYVVEAESPDGIPDWLGDFSAEEIEPVL